ncbi:MAG TPA: P-loop NTPase fold protein [Chloroflexia bacterium]|jgi:predicted KAP-like P-loop ATPase
MHTQLSPERPLHDPKYDRLGYAAFAQQLADGICRMSPPEGLVIGIYGAWGSGKSTILRFITHYIERMDPTIQPLIIPFNPWWFSGYEDLTRAFFSTLSAKIASSKDKGLEHTKKLVATFTDLYSTSASIIPLPGKDTAKALGDALRKTEEITVTKEKLSKALEGAGHRILIVIDDIDRLTPEEIRQLFGVVKAVADFPNVVYLLSFDKNVVIQALTTAQGMPGADYLEKIVQVPLELPDPDSFALFDMFLNQAKDVVSSTDPNVLQKANWNLAFQEVCEPFIKTPRDVSRIVNALTLTYPLVVNEVNPSDFVAIEALRLTNPNLYSIIRNNPGMFAGAGTFPAPTGGDHNPLSNHRDFIDRALQSVEEPNRSSTLRALSYLFPKIVSYYGPQRESYDAEDERRKQLRISSIDRFPVYFRLSLPTGAITRNELSAIVALASEPKDFSQRLIDLRGEKRPDGSPRLSEFLYRLAEFAEEIVPETLVEPLVRTLLTIGDQLIGEDELDAGDERHNDMWITSIIIGCLTNLEEPLRFELLQTALSNSRSITVIVQLVRSLGMEHGKFNSLSSQFEQSRTVTADHLQQLEVVVIEAIRNHAKNYTLLDSPFFTSLLSYWKDLTSTEELRAWFEEALQAKSASSKLLGHFVIKVSQHLPPGIPVVNKYGFDLITLREFSDTNILYSTLRELNAKEGVPAELQEAISTYLEHIDISERNATERNIIDENRASTDDA